MSEVDWKRVNEILYSSDSREEIAGRIVALEDMATEMYRTMGEVLAHSTDTVFVGVAETLRDYMDYVMISMHDLGIEPADYRDRARELGIEVSK